jgi:RNA polymerase sigma-70 factor (ECF subfamily)
MDDATRYDALFDGTYPAVRRYVHHRGLRGADADDVVAEVMLVAWRRLADVPVDDPIPWLFAVARNVWRNHQRSGRRRERLVERLPAPEVEPAIELPDDDAADAIVTALRSLTDADREVLMLVAWDGLTSDQLAVALGCTPGAARVRLHRARGRLAAALVTPDPVRTDLLHVSTPEGGSE